MESQPESSGAFKETSIVQERLRWNLVWRDDTKVMQGLYAGEVIKDIHETGDVGLLDEFFVFLEDLGILNTDFYLEALLLSARVQWLLGNERAREDARQCVQQSAQIGAIWMHRRGNGC